MNSILPVLKKELRSSFNSPIAYIAVIAFLVAVSVYFFFFFGFFARNQADLRPYFGFMPIVFIVLIPAITMRSWAEERKQGTIELLITLPFGEFTLALAKFFASWIILGLMVALTAPVPLLLSMFGSFDPGQVFCQYLGIILMGGASVALGSFISSLTKNQISAFIFTVLALLLLYVLMVIPMRLSVPQALGDLMRWLSYNTHYSSFEKGVLDSRDFLYYGISAAFFVWLTAKTLQFRKWR